MSNSAVTIRPYRRGDESRLTGLFDRAFGHPITVDHWLWKLRHTPTSVDNVWLALSDDQPVFQYAGIPVRFWQCPVTRLAMVSVDTMTAPEFRRQGLLTRVAGQVYAQWRERGVAFVLGLPNENWGSRAAALGWRSLFPLQWLARPLRPEAALARRMGWPALRHATLPATAWNRIMQRRLRRDPRIQLERLQRADARFDELWERCKGDWLFSTVRDRAWIDWRFLSSPSRAYEITLARREGRPTGYCVHALVAGAERVSAHLVDLFASSTDEATRDALLQELVERLLASGAEFVHTLAIPGTPYFRWLRRAGFWARQAFDVQVVPLSEDLPFELMQDRRHWNLTGADFDVV